MSENKNKSTNKKHGIKAAECLYGQVDRIERQQEYLDDYCPQCQRIESPKSITHVQHGYKAIFKCSDCAEAWSCYYAQDYTELERS